MEGKPLKVKIKVKKKGFPWYTLFLYICIAAILLHMGYKVGYNVGFKKGSDAVIEYIRKNTSNKNAT